ncbi:lysylphosphatidylglycerol synthase transmembrane domain-containing protein [Streptomyces hawaiiensis]
MSPQATGTRPRTTLTEQPGLPATAGGTRVPAPSGPVDTARADAAVPRPVVSDSSEPAASAPPGRTRTTEASTNRHDTGTAGPSGTGPDGASGPDSVSGLDGGSGPDGVSGLDGVHPDGTGTSARGPVRTALARLGSPKVRTHLGTLAGIAILSVLFWRLGTGVFLDGVRRIDGMSVLLALGIGLVTTVCSAWRWALVARGLRIRLPFGPAVADYYRALFLNAALPGGILGDVHRAVRHGQSEGDLRRGVKAVVLERTAGQLALFAAGAVVLLTMPSPVLAQARSIALPAALTALGALAVVLALRMNRAAPSPRGPKVRAFLAEAREGLLSRQNGPGVVVSSVVVLAGYVAMFVLAARVAGTAASVTVLLPLAVLALLAMGLPLNVGGWGPREGVTAWAFGAAGLGAGRGLAVAVVYGVLSLVASLPGLIVLVTRWYAGLRTGDRATPGAPAPQGDYASEVSNEKYAPKESARLARSSFPFSAEPSEGRPMTPESV